MNEPHCADTVASVRRALGRRRRRHAPAWAVLLLCCAAAPAAAQVEALTASFESVPERHEGSRPFAVELSFSAPMAGQTRVKLTATLRVTGAEVLRIRTLNSGVRDRWWIRLRPTSDAAVTLTLTAHGECASALCSADGLALSEDVSATIPGP